MADVQEFEPGAWGARDRLENVKRSAPAVLAAVVLLVVASRNLALGTTLAVAGVTLLVVVPAVVLFERRGYQRERVVVTPDAVEKRRGTRVLARVSRTGGLRAMRFTPESLGQKIGFEQLVLLDGSSSLRLTSARWNAQHDAILRAVGVDAPLVRAKEAHQRVPKAFPLWKRRPNLVAGLSVFGLIALFVVGAVVYALVVG